MNLGDIFNWKTILIFVIAFILGMILRYFITKNRNSTQRVRNKKKKQNKPQKTNYGALKGTKPNKKKKK